MSIKRQTFRDFFFATILLPALGAFAWHYRIEWLIWGAGFFSLGVLLGLVAKEYGLRKKAIANTYLLIAIVAVASAYYFLGNILNSLSAGVIAATAVLNIHAFGKSYQRYRAWQKTKQPAQETEELLEEIKDSYQFDLSALNTKRGLLTFVQSEEPITEAVTKFGGQPVWLDKPQWPISKKLGKPMHFIGQVALDTELFGNKQARMAYIFYSGYEDTCDITADFDSGENAIILQPGCEPPVQIIEQAEGPVMEHQGESDKRCEYMVKLDMGDDPEFVRDYELRDLTEKQARDYEKACSRTKIGGTPYFYQFDDFPDENPWQLLCQLDDFSVPFYVNFGTGMAYMFINSEGTKAKMMWQC